MKNKVIELYELLYQITSKNKHFKCKLSERDSKIVNNFLSKLTESHGEDWLFNFMTYQFSRYADQDTQFGKGKIMMGWVLGDKAIEKFKNVSSEELYYTHLFVTKNNIKNIFFELESITVERENYQHRERKRFYGTDQGLVHCKTTMNLYNPKHKDCIFCKHKEWCK